MPAEGFVSTKGLFVHKGCLHEWRRSLCSPGLVVLSCPPLNSMRQRLGRRPRTQSEALCCSAPAPTQSAERLPLTSHQLGQTQVALISSLGGRQGGRTKTVCPGPRDARRQTRHGCESGTRDGGAGCVGQPACLERGAPHLEAIVVPGPDAVQTPPGSVVRDWEVLPGRSDGRKLNSPG